MLVLFVLFSYLSSPASALPLQNTTSTIAPETSTKVGWYSAPQLRGTFDLLLSCLTTLSLCAWTAYHPNVNSTRSEWHRICHRLIWMVIAVFVPEVVLFCAWEQWWASRKLRNEINDFGISAFTEQVFENGSDAKNACDTCSAGELAERDLEASSQYHLDLLFGETDVSSDVLSEQDSLSINSATVVEVQPISSHAQSPPPRTSSEKTSHPPLWTTEQAFFALAGGFAVSSSSYSPYARLTFTPKGLVFLAKLGLLPRSSPEVVTDKSKADSVAKILVCIQAGWFLVQCIARVAQKLPLTLLELHVLTHVLCAFAMYLLWIEKPYDVGSPIMVDNETVIDLAALFSLHVDTFSYFGHGDTSECAQTSHILLSQVQGSHNDSLHLSTFQRYLRYLRTSIIEPEMLKPLSTLENLPATPKTTEHLLRANRALAYLKDHNVHFPYISKATHYLKPTTHNHHSDFEQDVHYELHTSIRLPLHLVVPLRSNLVIDGLDSYKENKQRLDQLLTTLKTYVGMSTVYGGLHLAAWNFSFQTSVEMWFWRASGLLMVAAPIISVFAILTLGLSSWLHKFAKPKGASSSRKPLGEMLRVGTKILWTFCRVLVETLNYPAILLAMCCWILYPVARGYVLAESFAALRACERDVYRTVEWTGFIPHAG